MEMRVEKFIIDGNITQRYCIIILISPFAIECGGLFMHCNHVNDGKGKYNGFGWLLLQFIYEIRFMPLCLLGFFKAGWHKGKI